MEGNIAGLLIIETSSSDKAEKNTKRMKNCPHLLACGQSSNYAFNLFIVPEEKRLWLEYPTRHPEVLGAKSVRLELIESLIFPESYNLRVPVEKLEVSPCGAKCLECPFREEFNCKGCPATVYYTE